MDHETNFFVFEMDFALGPEAGGLPFDLMVFPVGGFEKVERSFFFEACC